MEDWLIWFVAAIALVVAEMFTAGFWIACLAVGAVAAGIAALVPGLGPAVQGITFAASSLLSMAGLRPKLLQHFQLTSGSGVRTGVDALLGKTAVVTERIEPLSGLGRVKVDGEDWRGASADATVIEAGTLVTVIQVDGTTLMVEEVIEKAFKVKDSEYKYLVVGTSPERYAALKGGSVHATFMGAPFNFTAAREGFNKLITFHEILGPIQFTVDFVHQDYIKNHRDEIVRYLKSTIESTQWLYDKKNKEEALAIHMKVLKSKRDLAEQDYKFMIEEFQPFTRSGAVVKGAWDKTMELRAKEGHYKGKKIPAMSDFVDSSMIEEAQKLAGFKP